MEYAKIFEYADGTFSVAVLNETDDWRHLCEPEEAEQIGFQFYPEAPDHWKRCRFDSWNEAEEWLQKWHKARLESKGKDVVVRTRRVEL